MVSQEIMLFDTSIRENLTLGKIVADEVIWRVLEMVDLRRVVEELPGGLDFVFSKFGDLSSGQKQRLLLARAILKDSDVYFLDEATSAVDTETEQRIVDGLLEAGLIKTALVISHRFETIKYCNKVLVLKGGRVEAFDTMERIRIVSPTFNALFPG